MNQTMMNKYKITNYEKSYRHYTCQCACTKAGKFFNYYSN